MTDFGPLIANPITLLLGAAAQLGIFIAFLGATALGYTLPQAGSIGIIGGADGPTAIYLTSRLAPELLAPIAIAAYSYMALVPIIQPPIMKALVPQKEREIVMAQLRPVSQTERILFPIVVTIVGGLLVPSAITLLGSLMLGNLLRECKVVERLSQTAQNELINVVTIFIGLSVGATAKGTTFLTPATLGIIALGLVAFAGGTAGGVILGRIMCALSGGRINPLIGAAGGLSGTHGRSSCSEGRTRGQSVELLAHACHGTQRLRRYWLRGRGRRFPGGSGVIGGLSISIYARELINCEADPILESASVLYFPDCQLHPLLNLIGQSHFRPVFPAIPPHGGRF